MILSKKNGIISVNAKIARRINHAAILNLIREHQPISRVALSKLSHLNKSTVSSIVGDLLAENFIVEKEIADANVGRNPLLLRLKRRQHFVGAIDIDIETTLIAVADIDGSIMKMAAVPTQTDDVEKFILSCLSALSSLQEGLRLGSLAGLGVSIAGLVDPLRGRVIISANLGWKDVDLAGIFNKHFRGGAVFYGNDANASALAELWFGKRAKKIENFVFISEGLGAGIVLGKKLFEGSFHSAGEFGHMTVIEPGGERCLCGNNGCWEVYASNKSIIARHYARLGLADALPMDARWQQLFEQAQRGEEAALETLREAGRYLGMGVSNIIKALDPEAVIFGGRIVRAWHIIYPEIVQEVSRRVFFGIEKNTRILATSFKMRPSLMGAATLAIQEIFSGLQVSR